MAKDGGCRRGVLRSVFLLGGIPSLSVRVSLSCARNNRAVGRISSEESKR